MKVLEVSGVGTSLKGLASGTGEFNRNDRVPRDLFDSPVNADLDVVFGSL